jgi:hypothetical protein
MPEQQKRRNNKRAQKEVAAWAEEGARRTPCPDSPSLASAPRTRTKVNRVHSYKQKQKKKKKLGRGGWVKETGSCDC